MASPRLLAARLCLVFTRAEAEALIRLSASDPAARNALAKIRTALGRTALLDGCRDNSGLASDEAVA